MVDLEDDKKNRKHSTNNIAACPYNKCEKDKETTRQQS